MPCIKLMVVLSAIYKQFMFMIEFKVIYKVNNITEQN